MSSSRFRFGHFVLDAGNRRLTQDGMPVALNSRYLDALILLVQQQGQLVNKERFLEDVWKGVPVTDEVITQCIKTLRKQLGDSASNPKFIETVPKHGYRFIEVVETPLTESSSAQQYEPHGKFQRLVALGTVGTLGGGIAGVLGGLFYGFTAVSASSVPHGEGGAVSIVLVVLALTTLIAVIGGTGVGFGVAAARVFVRQSLLLSVAGGAAGGLLVGAFVKLLGVDAINLLFGQSPGDVTGATEGLILGGAVGLGIGLAFRKGPSTPPGGRISSAALIGACAGCLIALLGGRLMVGSLDLLVRQFSGSRLRLDPLGTLFGEPGFGETSQLATSCLEGALFAACIVAALTIVQRRENSASLN